MATNFCFLVASVIAVKVTDTSTSADANLQRAKSAALALGIECEEMCKTVGSYPEGCACPGWNGQPASSSDMDTRGCYDKYCVPIAHTDDPCPSDDFLGCVEQNSKVPALLQMNYGALQYRIEQTRGVLRFMNKQQARNKAAAVVRGVECEEMCKTLGQYPAGCQCPGWNGSPASSADLDDRGCYAKYCEPIAHTPDPCPSDDFVTCVSTKTSFLQVNWKDRTKKIMKAIQAMVQSTKSSPALAKKLLDAKKR